MARVGEIVATLRFFGDDLDPDELSGLLGCSPTRSHRKGDPVTKDGRGSHRTNGWLLESALDRSASLDEHVSGLFAQVTSEPDAWNRIARFGPDLFVGLFLTDFNQGDAVSPATASLLAARGVRLSLEVYGLAKER